MARPRSVSYHARTRGPMTSDTSQGGDPRIGTVLRGKYRLDRVIGRGGMAVVYKATHRNHAEFAVKMLHPELSIVEDVRSRFVREGYAANAVKHPGAVLVVDDDVAEDGAAFLVMELLDGLAGDQLWGSVGSRVPIEVASAIAIQLLDVLSAAHAKGIIHRDIKPANLFLTRDGTVKVLDFGIARAREAIVGAQATGSGMTLGTPAFMAPEHARGRSREMDGRTDLWSVGATFFAMVSGELVHTGETSNEFLIAAGTNPARSLASVVPDAPAPLVEVIDRALAFSKGDRWPTAAAMRGAMLEVHRANFGAADLEEVVAGAVKAHVPPPAPVASQLAPAAETKTSVPTTSRSGTERLSTSAAIARDRDSLRPRSRSWAFGLGATVLLALGATVLWLRSHPAAVGVDAGSNGALTGALPDAMTNPERADLPDARANANETVAEAPPAPALPDAVERGSSAPEDRALSGRSPHAPSHSRAHPAPPPALAVDAGPAPPSCSPPWFLDSAGHKQYKPECL
jgi:serine/threonine protein kinase